MEKQLGNRKVPACVQDAQPEPGHWDYSGRRGNPCRASQTSCTGNEMRHLSTWLTVDKLSTFRMLELFRNVRFWLIRNVRFPAPVRLPWRMLRHHSQPGARP
jgi:hypothetical protein